MSICSKIMKNISVEQYAFEENFKYLGVNLNYMNGMNNGVQLMLNSENPEYNAMNKLFSYKLLFNETNRKLYLYLRSLWCNFVKRDR